MEPFSADVRFVSLAVAKADHADTYTRLPPSEKGELAAVVALLNPHDGLRGGFVARP